MRTVATIQDIMAAGTRFRRFHTPERQVSDNTVSVFSLLALSIGYNSLLQPLLEQGSMTDGVSDGEVSHKYMPRICLAKYNSYRRQG